MKRQRECGFCATSEERNACQLRVRCDTPIRIRPDGSHIKAAAVSYIVVQPVWDARDADTLRAGIIPGLPDGAKARQAAVFGRIGGSLQGDQRRIRPKRHQACLGWAQISSHARLRLCGPAFCAMAGFKKRQMWGGGPRFFASPLPNPAHARRGPCTRVPHAAGWRGSGCACGDAPCRHRVRRMVIRIWT